MAAVATQPVADPGEAPAAPEAPGDESPAPVLFLYSHLHDAIRSELDALSSAVLELDGGGGGEGDAHAEAALLRLRDRYRFLEQVYKYHSAVEDEVVYPALDAKVKNVTSAYSVEHQDEEYLLEQLGQLLSAAVSQPRPERAATARQLACKVEAIHTTLRKHLAKEEAQLLPLLLARFSHTEQAELVAQFLYCIPLDTVGRVVAWLRPAVPAAALRQLLGHLRGVVPDDLLLQLLATWLDPAGGGGSGDEEGSTGAEEESSTDKIRRCVQGKAGGAGRG